MDNVYLPEHLLCLIPLKVKVALHSFHLWNVQKTICCTTLVVIILKINYIKLKNNLSKPRTMFCLVMDQHYTIFTQW